MAVTSRSPLPTGFQRTGKRRAGCRELGECLYQNVYPAEKIIVMSVTIARTFWEKPTTFWLYVRPAPQEEAR